MTLSWAKEALLKMVGQNNKLKIGLGHGEIDPWSVLIMTSPYCL